MQILVADKIAEAGRTALERAGHSVTYDPSLAADALPTALAQTGASVLVVRSTKVTAAALEASPSLTLVIRAGAGVNNIDLACASRRGVFVANCPGKNAIAVAELCMGLLLSIDRQIPDAVATVRAGRWEKKRFQGARGLFGRRLGLVGFGNIACELATRARAFGMPVSAWTPRLTAERCEAHDVELAPSLDALLRNSDVLSVHVPFNGQTQHLIDAAALAKLPDGAVVLHTARGGVVDDTALEQAVATGKLRAGLDVFEAEPSGGSAAFESKLAATEGVYATPHIGASTQQASSAIADEVVEIVRDFCERGDVRNCVNLQAEHDADWILVVRHLDEVGVLARVLHRLREAGLNVQQMSNVVFQGGAAASATISVEGEPDAALLAALEAEDAVLGTSVRRIVTAGQASPSPDQN